MNNREIQRRRRAIAEAMRAPRATMDAVATRFGVGLEYVQDCCREHKVSLKSKAGPGSVNVFAVLMDLLAGKTWKECAILHHVSVARVEKIAAQAHAAGFAQLTDYFRRNGARKRRRYSIQRKPYPPMPPAKTK
jgi:hypothetical protein